MLYQVGPVQFRLQPLNVDDVEEEGGADFAKKDVLGRRKPNEWVGEGDVTLKLSGKIFPETFGGNVSGLRALRKAGMSVPVTRGDGAVMGWYVITKLRLGHGDIGPNGVGREVKLDVELTLDDPPLDPADVFSMLVSLFQ